jgi:hypothetical protein
VCMTSRNITTVRTKWTFQDEKIRRRFHVHVSYFVRSTLHCAAYPTVTCWLVSSPRQSVYLHVWVSQLSWVTVFFELDECTLYYNSKEHIHQIHKIWRYLIHIYYTILYTTYMASFSPGLVQQIVPSLTIMTAQWTVVKTKINLNYF